MPRDYRSSHHNHDHEYSSRHHAGRRTSNRETVQSDELSSTNGARLISNKHPHNPRDPHLSQTSLPVINNGGTPHPKSPAGRARQQAQNAQQAQEASSLGSTGFSSHNEYSSPRADLSGSFHAVHAHNAPLPHIGEGAEYTRASQTGVHHAYTSGHSTAPSVENAVHTRPSQTGVHPTLTGSHATVRGAENQHHNPPAGHSAQFRAVNGTETHHAIPASQSSQFRAAPASQSSQFRAVGETGVHHTIPASESAQFRAVSSAEVDPAVRAQHSTSFRAVEQPAEKAQSHNYQDFTTESGRYKAAAAHTPTSSLERFPLAGETAKHGRKRKRPFPRAVVAVAIVAAIGIAGFFGYQQIALAGPVTATVNGESMTLQGSERTVEGLLDNNIVQVTPGNFVAVDESVLREGDGTRCTALINEQPAELNSHINEGDQVVISSGTDVMENYTDSDPVAVPAGYQKTNTVGALHVFLPGQDGETVTRTGSESGKIIQQTTKEMVDNRLVYYNADTNGEKVIALTFDDGPWDTTTDQILDILKENGAKATFYTIGDQISAHTEQVARMAKEGHEIATHTWDHAAGSGKGVSLNLMSTQERLDEVQKGMQAIKDASDKDASTYFRAPGGNFDDSVANDLKGIIQGEIGWNIDTEDWQRPGADAIASRIKSAKPGEVILMHDGGGDRSQTVAGLREGLKYLKDQGYKFITITELIEDYPYQENQHF